MFLEKGSYWAGCVEVHSFLSDQWVTSTVVDGYSDIQWTIWDASIQTVKWLFRYSLWPTFTLSAKNNTPEVCMRSTSQLLCYSFFFHKTLLLCGTFIYAPFTSFINILCKYLYWQIFRNTLACDHIITLACDHIMKSYQHDSNQEITVPSIFK